MFSKSFLLALFSVASAQSAVTGTGAASGSAASTSVPYPLTNGTNPAHPTGGFGGTALGTGTTTSPAAMVTPSNVMSGYFSLPATPSVCSGSTIPFKTSVPMLGKQISVWDNDQHPFWFIQPHGTLWTFSTNATGVALGNPYFDQGTDPLVLPRQNGSSFTANVSTTGDGQMMFQVFSSNSSEMPPASEWNTSIKHQGQPQGKPLFYLDIEGSGPCSNPISANQSCAAGTLQLTTENWIAYDVDDWFGSWVKGAGPFSNTSSMMQKYASQFMNNVCSPCTYDQQCQCQESCANLPNNGKGSDAEKIWLAWKAMENLSDMVNNIWESIVIADSNVLGNIGNIALDFVDASVAVTQGTAPEDQISKANHILGALSPWINFIAPFLFPEADLGLKITSTLMGFTSAMLTMEDKPGTAPITVSSEQLNTVLKAQGGLSDYVTSIESSIEGLHNEIFTNGINITEYLSGGAFVNRTLLGLDCDSCKQEAQGWTMQYLSLKMLNYVWWVQNVFISYVPYGTIISNSNGEQTQFTEDICAGVFLKNDPDLVWCHTEDAVAGTKLKPGMARLTYYKKDANGNSPTHPNPNQDEINQHSNGVLNMTTTTPGVTSTAQFNTTSPNVSYKFNKTDIMASSIAGFAKYGFGGDGLAAMVQSINAAQNLNETIEGWKNMFNVAPTTPGMFNIPVCVSYNLNYWPTIYGTDGKPQGDQWCVCNSPWSVDLNGRQFNSSTPSDLTTLVSMAYSLDGNQLVCAPSIWGTSAPGFQQANMSPTIGATGW